MCWVCLGGFPPPQMHLDQCLDQVPPARLEKEDGDWERAVAEMGSWSNQSLLSFIKVE